MKRTAPASPARAPEITALAPATIVFLLLQMAFAAVAGGQEREEIFSGPQAGEKLVPFTVTGVYDDLAGKKLDFIAEADGRPILLIFVHKLTRPSFGLTRLLTRWAAAHSRGEKGAARLYPRIVWLQDDRSAAEEYLLRARRSLRIEVPVGISVDGAEGPGAYGLNRKVTLTVLVGKGGRVLANFALVQPSDTDAPRILAAVARAIGEKPPSREEIARYDPRRAGGRRGMRKGMRGKEMARTDERLRRAVERLRTGDLAPERVKALAARIEKHVEADRKLRRDLGLIARAAVSRRDFASTGTPAARKVIAAWARRFGGRGAARETAKDREKKEAKESARRPLPPELTGLLRGVIQRDLSPEEVDRAAASVDAYLAGHDVDGRELVRIARVVIGRKYGTGRAREHFSRWIEKYTPGPREKGAPRKSTRGTKGKVRRRAEL